MDSLCRAWARHALSACSAVCVPPVRQMAPGGEKRACSKYTNSRQGLNWCCNCHCAPATAAAKLLLTSLLHHFSLVLQVTQHPTCRIRVTILPGEGGSKVLGRQGPAGMPVIC